MSVSVLTLSCGGLNCCTLSLRFRCSAQISMAMLEVCLAISSRKLVQKWRLFFSRRGSCRVRERGTHTHTYLYYKISSLYVFYVKCHCLKINTVLKKRKWFPFLLYIICFLRSIELNLKVSFITTYCCKFGSVSIRIQWSAQKAKLLLTSSGHMLCVHLLKWEQSRGKEIRYLSIWSSSLLWENIFSNTRG